MTDPITLATPSPPTNAQPTQQALLDAVARWRDKRELPEDRSLATMVGLAACDPSVLHALGLAPEQAWSAIDGRARSMIAAWARAVTSDRRPRKPAQGSGQRLPARTRTGDELRALRLQRGEEQGRFWPRLGATQSAGSRYEAGRELNTPLALLLELWLSGALSDDDLARLGRYAARDTTGLPAGSRKRLALALDDPAAFRRASGLSQEEFWGRLGLTQSGGSRHEMEDRHNTSLRRLLAGLAVGLIDEMMLAAVSRSPS